MPAYGNALNPSETKALMRFLMTLRGNNLSPAIDASRTLTQANPSAIPPGQVALAHGPRAPIGGPVPSLWWPIGLSRPVSPSQFC
jgi:hypothetical protein